MNRYRMRFAPHVWTPALSPWFVSMMRPLRLRQQRRDVRVHQVNVQGADIVSQHLRRGDGVMIMPNHSSHADPYVIYSAADALDTAIHIMATWHVFQDQSPLVRWLLRKHGCFSVDREANDIGAFRRAADILMTKPEPLVIFPEGEIYHCNDRVTPFREGAAAIAVMAARKAQREIVCIPCAISYRYEDDPTPALTETMGQLEEAMFWRRKTDKALHERIYRFAEALLAVKELEYFDTPQTGQLPQRIRDLGDHVLRQVELRHGLSGDGGASIPERIKAARRTLIDKIQDVPQAKDSDKQEASNNNSAINDDLEDLFMVVQSFSYPGDYVNESPTIERMAETIDKFEEDVLRRPTANIKAQRSVTVRFGESIPVSSDRKLKNQTNEITSAIEASVQAMLTYMRST